MLYLLAMVVLHSVIVIILVQVVNVYEFLIQFL